VGRLTFSRKGRKGGGTLRGGGSKHRRRLRGKKRKRGSHRVGAYNL